MTRTDTHKTECPYCRRLFDIAGLSEHIRAKHKKLVRKRAEELKATGVSDQPMKVRNA